MGELSVNDRIPIPKTDGSMPRLGFGVYQLYGDACQKAVLAALDAGFRHVDSAQMYRNESEVGAAVQQSSLSRQDVFLTTKIRTATGTPESTYKNALDSVNKIGGDGGYVDLFLIHVPGSSREAREELWKALERLHDEGKAKAIGVSNFRIQHLEEMREYARIWPPHVNQLEVLSLHCRGLDVRADREPAAPSLVPAPRTRPVLPRQRHRPAGLLAPLVRREPR